MTYAFGKSTGNPIGLEVIKEGYELAEKFLRRK
jgi:hypothetical protein